MRFSIITLICLIFGATGCSTDDPTRPNTFVPLTSIEVTGTYGTIADMTVDQYTAVGDFSGVFTRDMTAEVAWEIENDTIASVSSINGSEGLVTALSPGQTTITASAGEIAGSAPVIVTNAFLTGITISPQDTEFQAGVTLQYSAAGTFSDGSVQAVTALAAWESSDPDIATIDSAGLATTLRTGTSTIRGTWQGLEATADLLVTGATLTSIAVMPSEGAVAQGTTMEFVAEGTFSDDSILDITDIVEWQSSDTSVGIINVEGLATAIKPGETEIKASFVVDGAAISDTASLIVTDEVVESINISPEDSAIAKGSSLQFSATGTFSDDSVQDLTDLVTWHTSDYDVGTISNSPTSPGLFLSSETGDTVIEAIFDGISGETILTVE